MSNRIKNLTLKSKLSYQLAYMILWIYSTYLKRYDWHKSFDIEPYLKLIKSFDEILSERGEKGCIIWCKECRLLVFQFLSDSTHTNKPLIKVTHDRLPIVLGALIPILRQLKKIPSDELTDSHIEVWHLKLILTVFHSSRQFKRNAPMDIKSITSEKTYSLDPDLLKYTRDFWRTLGYRPSNRTPKSLSWTNFHMTTKAGPNGHALDSCLVDLKAFDENLIQDLSTLGGKKFAAKLNILVKAINTDIFNGIFPQKPEPKTRKLSKVLDKEHKVRVIAIVDYFSQTVLKRLHKYLFRVLKKIQQDMTFAQGQFKMILDNQVDQSLKDSYMSIDLKSATDRFPMEFICGVLKGHLPSDYINTWCRVMVGHPFYNSETKTYVSYSVGNPMGAYSSWASFAVANHYVVYLACRRLGLDWRTAPYALLGDDIVIANKQLGEMYMSIIKSLGVEISVQKTHTSPYFFEFAKRLFYKDIEISPFPISSYKECSKRYYRLTNLLLELNNKGWFCDDIPRAIRDLYGSVQHKRSKFRNQMKDRSFINIQVMTFMRNKGVVGLCLRQVASYLGYPEEWVEENLNDTTSLRLIQQISKTLWLESNPTHEKHSMKKQAPLGDYAFDIVLKITGHKDYTVFDEGFHAGTLPQVTIFGLVSEMWREYFILSDGFDPGKLQENEDWDIMITSMMLPMSDSIFNMRTRDKKLVLSSIWVSKIIDSIKSFANDHNQIGISQKDIDIITKRSNLIINEIRKDKLKKKEKKRIKPK